MAATFAERWQSCAFQLTDYAKEKIYSAILSVIVSRKRCHTSSPLYSSNIDLSFFVSCFLQTPRTPPQWQPTPSERHKAQRPGTLQDGSCNTARAFNSSRSVVVTIQQDVAVVMSALRECTDIALLDLSYNGITVEGIKHLAEYLKVTHSSPPLSIHHMIPPHRGRNAPSLPSI